MQSHLPSPARAPIRTCIFLQWPFLVLAVKEMDHFGNFNGEGLGSIGGYKAVDESQIHKVFIFSSIGGNVL